MKTFKNNSILKLKMKKIFLIFITIFFTSNAIAEGNKFKSKDIKGF